MDLIKQGTMMSNTLKISISGVRGLIGNKEGLTPELTVNFAQAFGSWTKGGKIIIGRDSRPTGEMVKRSVLAGLQSVGCDVIDIGIVPTPTVLLMVKKLKASGGIAITASHNPLDWNALKLIHRDGRFLNQREANRLLNIFKNRAWDLKKWDQTGSVKTADQYETWHTHASKIFSKTNKTLIRSKGFRVALDPVNGAGSEIVPWFLKELGCKVSMINGKPNGLFGRGAEPVPENLGALSRLVKRSDSDIGFALDPDADRLSLISEKGIPLGEEYTLALAIFHVLKKKKGPVVLNLATSLASEEVAKKAKQKVYRTRIGEINVTEKMLKINGLIGGEGNGGVIYPLMNLGRDSLAGMALILELMAVSGKPVSLLKACLPSYSIVKKKCKVPEKRIKPILQRITKEYSSYQVNTQDGVRIRFKDSWVIIRASNTEPVVRVIAEAPTDKEAETLTDLFLKKLK